MGRKQAVSSEPTAPTSVAEGNVDGPRPLSTKNNKTWKFKDRNDNFARVSYPEKLRRRKDTYATKLKYVYRGDIPVSNIVYVAPVE